jgi:hypothetical protein
MTGMGPYPPPGLCSFAAALEWARLGPLERVLAVAKFQANLVAAVEED